MIQMTVKKVNSWWYVFDSEGMPIANFTTKKAALHAIESYKANGIGG